MEVFKIQHSQRLCGSSGVKSVISDEGFDTKVGGFGDDEDDY